MEMEMEMETSTPEAVNLGKSMIVPSVQELSKAPIFKIPPRYLRDDQDPPVISSGASSVPSVPVIDLRSLLTGEKTDLELEKLHSACKEWGFFQVTNHGVNDTLVEKFKEDVISFFGLPLDEKRKLWQQPNNHEGFGQLFVLSEEQKLDWSDMFYITTHPTCLRQPRLFELLPPNLRETFDAYVSELQELSRTLLGFMAKALKIDIKEMEIFENGRQSVRITYYPPCPEPEKVMGIVPHSDASGITILLQVNGVGGLQIKKDGAWVPVNVLPDALVVNVGDFLEILSNGIYKSIEHRAIVNQTKERISVAMFFNPKLEAEIGPATSFLSLQNPPLFRRIGVATSFREFFSRELDGKSFLENTRIGNEEDKNDKP